jgi:hypothetical protein
MASFQTVKEFFSQTFEPVLPSPSHLEIKGSDLLKNRRYNLLGFGKMIDLMLKEGEGEQREGKENSDKNTEEDQEGSITEEGGEQMSSRRDKLLGVAARAVFPLHSRWHELLPPEIIMSNDRDVNYTLQWLEKVSFLFPPFHPPFLALPASPFCLDDLCSTTLPWQYKRRSILIKFANLEPFQCHWDTRTIACN